MKPTVIKRIEKRLTDSHKVTLIVERYEFISDGKNKVRDYVTLKWYATKRGEITLLNGLPRRFLPEIIELLKES